MLLRNTVSLSLPFFSFILTFSQSRLCSYGKFALVIKKSGLENLNEIVEMGQAAHFHPELLLLVPPVLHACPQVIWTDQGSGSELLECISGSISLSSTFPASFFLKSGAKLNLYFGLIQNNRSGLKVPFWLYTRKNKKRLLYPDHLELKWYK